jgi:hypothetical protein
LRWKKQELKLLIFRDSKSKKISVVLFYDSRACGIESKESDMGILVLADKPNVSFKDE